MEAKKMDFIKLMLDSNVLLFGDFVTKSGRNTPYFINTGNYCTGEQISKLSGYYSEVVNEMGDDLILFGPAYKGIPLVAGITSHMYNNFNKNVSFSFNRKEVKDHGEGGSLVGYKPKAGERVVIIEDVITAGTSVEECMPILKNSNVTDLLVAVDRSEVAPNRTISTRQYLTEQYGIKVHSIVSIYDIYEYIKDVEKDTELLARMDVYISKYCL